MTLAFSRSISRRTPSTAAFSPVTSPRSLSTTTLNASMLGLLTERQRNARYVCCSRAYYFLALTDSDSQINRGVFTEVKATKIVLGQRNEIVEVLEDEARRWKSDCDGRMDATWFSPSGIKTAGYIRASSYSLCFFCLCLPTS